MAIVGMDDARLRRAFLEESEALAQSLGRSLLALEAEPSNRDIVNEVFRLTHSLKSESALIGFSALSSLAHVMEDALGAIRDSRRDLDETIMDRLLEGSDLITDMIAAISGGGSESDFDVSAVKEALAAEIRGVSVPEMLPAAPRQAGAAEAQGSGPESTSSGTMAATPFAAAGAAPTPAAETELDPFERRQLEEARDRGETVFRLVLAVDESEPMKYARAYLAFANLELITNVIRTTPSMDGDPADDARYRSIEVLLSTMESEQAVRAAVKVDQVSVAEAVPLSYRALLGEALDVGGKPAGPEGAAQELLTASSAPGVSPLAPAGAPAEDRLVEQAARPGLEKISIRVDTRKLDDLWSLVAELVVHKSQIARLSERAGKGADAQELRGELAESFESLEKIAGGMQQTMMDTRMIPISVIFNKFPRLVRDLSRKLGKTIDLLISGQETEIDRGIVEILSDPLTHIIRNSIDHGIEFPEERVRRGKPEKGRVSVAARQQGGKIVIELADDGRGVDLDRIREKAISRGLPNAAALGDEKLLDLVFLPGFSTRDTVTDLSGRGVGMDVVATRIKTDLKGDVVLHSEKGAGTRITLVLPLTLTIVNSLVVRDDDQTFAIPLTDVDGTVKVLNTEIRGEEGREIYAHPTGEMPLFHLGSLLGRGRRMAEEYFAVIVRNGAAQGCLVVDELVEERQVVIRPVDDLLNFRKLFSGVTVVEDGRIVFILDTSFISRKSIPMEARWARES